MTARILVGDVFDKLRELPDESVHCVVTSPPYWGLRDYSVAGQIGLEPTVGEHIEVMVRVFREVRRVLRKDGTVWLNYGDCYHNIRTHMQGGANRATRHQGLKEKDLCMMPARLAIALQEDGWWIRSEIIWAKPNPMPESVTDRPTSSHEKVFLLTKSARYFYDSEAVRVPAARPDWRDESDSVTTNPCRNDGGNTKRNPKRDKQTRRGSTPRHDGANLRNVWHIATRSYPGAHFATFPPALVEPCIKAGTSEKGVCPECGVPWVRETETGELSGEAKIHTHGRPAADERGVSGSSALRTNGRTWREIKTLGWSLSCECGGVPVPAVVLDLFAGSGTVGLVADRLDRDSILIELNPDYAEMARQRLDADGGMFSKTEIA
jgi:DNA modification methylase|tara:strand:- start:241 stop:1377 length:1137 start_codon:yes stop_codon:yes gene_type:complete